MSPNLQKFPRVREITKTPKCSLCTEGSVLTVTIQRSPYRKYHDSRLNLCARCLAAHGTSGLPIREKKQVFLELWRELKVPLR